MPGRDLRSDSAVLHGRVRFLPEACLVKLQLQARVLFYPSSSHVSSVLAQIWVAIILTIG